MYVKELIKYVGSFGRLNNVSLNRVRHRGGPDRLDHRNGGSDRANASPRRSGVGCKL